MLKAELAESLLRLMAEKPFAEITVREIAEEAGISKSLLFHYFRNKKELYLYLWEKCAQITIEYLTKYDCYGQRDLFESMLRGMRAKMDIIRQYPHMAFFTIKAFYEKDPEIKEILTSVYQSLQEKGYNPINQIVGYILSEDPTYITNYNNARALIRKLDRDELLQELVKQYLMD